MANVERVYDDLAPSQYKVLVDLAIEWTRRLKSTPAGRELLEKEKRKLQAKQNEQ